jgi:hypothetical protein
MLVQDFTEALARDPATLAWLNGHGHTLIAVLNESAGASAAAVIEILCPMRDHDLVSKAQEAKNCKLRGQGAFSAHRQLGRGLPLRQSKQK